MNGYLPLFNTTFYTLDMCFNKGRETGKYKLVNINGEMLTS